MKRSLVIIAILISAMVEIHAQTIPVNKQFGKVSKEELGLSVYEPDTSAVALVLYENQDICIDFDENYDFYLTTKKHIRLKILKEEGLDRADFELIHLVAGKLRETIRGIEVVTYNLKDGRIEENRMPKSAVYDEDYIDDYKKVTFSAVNVKVGSVIEVKYEISSNIYWDIDEVYFQKNIPVNCSECEIRIPKMFTFNKRVHGYHKVDYESDSSTSVISLRAGSMPYEIQIDKFHVSDLPAFKKEPYVYNIRQHYTALYYDIRSLAFPGSKPVDFSVTWDDVDENYLESLLMQRFKSPCQFKDAVKTLSADGSDPLRIASASSLVKQSVSWNGEYALNPSVPAQVVKNGSGTNVDINCLLAGCLREMGYEVDPVMIKLRSSGVLIEYHPEVHPFDTFILCVKAADGRLYYIDGGSNNAFVNILPPLMLVPNARLIKPKQCGWVDLTNLSRNNLVMSVYASLKPDMTFEGKVDARFTGVRSYEEKSDFHSCGSEDKYIENMEQESSIEIGELTVTGTDEYSSQMMFSYDYVMDADPMGDMIYVSPFLTRFHSPDAFQSLTRSCPIDFPSAYSVTYMYALNIPEGYSIEQVPENLNIKTEALDAIMRLDVQTAGAVVKVIFTYNQKSMNGFMEDYETIRQFWQYINDVYDSMIVLKKI
jgi:hypothetical protein